MWGIFYFLGKVDRTFIFGEGWGEGGEGKEAGVEERGGRKGEEGRGEGGERGRLDHSCSEPSMRKLPQNTPVLSLYGLVTLVTTVVEWEDAL